MLPLSCPWARVWLGGHTGANAASCHLISKLLNRTAPGEGSGASGMAECVMEPATLALHPTEAEEEHPWLVWKP